MTLLLPAQAEEQLSHVAQQIAQWRQSRTTPRGRIPTSLWTQAVALAQWKLGRTPCALCRNRHARADYRDRGSNGM